MSDYIPMFTFITLIMLVLLSIVTSICISQYKNIDVDLSAQTKTHELYDTNCTNNYCLYEVPCHNMGVNYTFKTYHQNFTLYLYDDGDICVAIDHSSIKYDLQIDLRIALPPIIVFMNMLGLFYWIAYATKNVQMYRYTLVMQHICLVIIIVLCGFVYHQIAPIHCDKSDKTQIGLKAIDGAYQIFHLNCKMNSLDYVMKSSSLDTAISAYFVKINDLCYYDNKCDYFPDTLLLPIITIPIMEIFLFILYLFMLCGGQTFTRSIENTMNIYN